jgi:hypothetical protein
MACTIEELIVEFGTIRLVWVFPMRSIANKAFLYIAIKLKFEMINGWKLEPGKIDFAGLRTGFADPPTG